MINKIKRYFYNRKVMKLSKVILPTLLACNEYGEIELAVTDSIILAKQLIKEVYNG